MRHARAGLTTLSRPVTTVTLRGIRSHGVRFALAVAAVALGIAFVTGSFAFRDLLSASIERTVATTLTADVYVQAPTTTEATGPGGGQVPTSLADELAALDGVSAAVIEASGPAALIAADGSVVDPGMGFSLALAPEADPTTTLVTGSWPAAGEVVLESSALQESGLTIGGEATVVLNGLPHTMHVSGEFSVSSLAVGSVLIGLDPTTAHDQFVRDGAVSRIAVFPEPGTDADALLARTEQALDPQAAEAVSGTDLRTEASEQIEQFLGFLRTFLVMFAAAALISGGFVIANSFAMSIRERSHEFAVLRSVGTSTSRILASVLAQATTIGVVGSALGVLIGGRLVLLVQNGLAAWGMGFSGTPSLSTRDAVLGFALGMVMSLVAAALPALRAARVAPVEAIRTESMPAKRLERILGGIAAGAAGAGLLVVASRVGSTIDGKATGVAFLDQRDPETLLLLGAAGIVAGVLLITPSLTRPMMSVLAAPVALFAGTLGRLARGNLVRDARRTANTAGGLMIGMALVTFTGIAAESTRESLRTITDVEVGADLIVGSATGVVPPAAIDTVRSTPGIATVDVVRLASTTVTGGGVDADAGSTSTMEIAGVQAETFGRAIDPVIALGDPAKALTAQEAVVLRAAARDAGWTVGDRIGIGPANEAISIGAIVDSHLLGSGVIVPDDVFDRAVPEVERIVRSAYVVAGDAPVPTVRADLLTAVEPYLVLSVRDREEAASAYADSVGEMVAIIYAVLALSVVIALLGIVNTLALSVIERTREIGLLRTVGVGVGQLAVVIALEAVLTSVYGTLLGIAAGAGISAALPGALADRGLTVFAVPWRDLGVVICAAVAIGLIASVAPAWRATRIPMLKAVVTD